MMPHWPTNLLRSHSTGYHSPVSSLRVSTMDGWPFMALAREVAPSFLMVRLTKRVAPGAPFRMKASVFFLILNSVIMEPVPASSWAVEAWQVGQRSSWLQPCVLMGESSARQSVHQSRDQ